MSAPLTQPPILLDTNLLVLWVVGQYDLRLIGRRGLDTFTPDDFKLLMDIVEPCQRRLTTPHILAECSNIADKCIRRTYHPLFADLFRTLLMTLDERWVPAVELSLTGEFGRLGLADAAICHLAASGAKVLSVDAELCNALWTNSADAENFNSLRDL